MDDEELALYFAAKKENEELKERLKDIKKKYSDILTFVKVLHYHPKFWSKTYKTTIEKWLEEHNPKFPEK